MSEYKPTLNVTQTAFSMKANLPQNEPARIKFWDEMGLSSKIAARRQGAPKFILHDGPPFANGDIHMGTALNKILKDIIVKHRTLKGFDAPFVPGWDCHGMPIEHKVVEQLGEAAKTMGKVEVRKKCRNYALKFMERQRDEFLRLGVRGDFEHPYLTLSPEYEDRIVDSFQRMLLEGYITRGERPILWCPVCQSALAEAEVEYADHESISVTVAFPVKTWPSDVFPGVPREKMHVLIWTTTPWTLPANLGISLHHDYLYVAVKVGDRFFVLAKDLLNATAAAAGWKDYEVVGECLGQKLDRAVCRHPFLDKDSLVMVGAHVTADAGTGCVHTAPGHGREDYEIGLKYGLPVYSPVDEAGKYTAKFPEFQGVSVWDANEKIVEKLRGLGCLLAVERIKHSYPHCWRSKNPVIFRATSQWFVQLDHKDLRRKALGEIDSSVRWIPSWGHDRIRNMMEGRVDWCISRQRSWGVPIMALYCADCGKVVVDEKVSENVRALVRKEHVDGWFQVGPEAVLPEGYRCSCGSTSFKKEEDILDVWFESGVSHRAVLEDPKHPELRWPADLYLEGGDQHRGWFQHALWTGVALKGGAPFKQVLTHGWVLDGTGKAMHKSAGNVIDPMDMMKEFGADILRLWVASEDYTQDVSISKEMLARLSEAYRRVRNTFRFILGNLSDFDPAKDSVPEADLQPLDRWATLELRRFLLQADAAYEAYEFTRVFHELDNFCAVTLSARYFDILKDRLYTHGAASASRRSAQTALYRILKSMATAVSPILSFTAEEVWQALPEGSREQGSVFLSDYPSALPLSEAETQELEGWGRLFLVREEAAKALEGLRRDKTIGSSLEAEIDLYVSQEGLRKLLEARGEDLRYDFLVARVGVHAEAAPPGSFKSERVEGLFVRAAKTTGAKCARCWNHYPKLGSDPSHPELCDRCLPVVRAHSPGREG
jgi:isoleucyl-tRNA synthetase